MWFKLVVSKFQSTPDEFTENQYWLDLLIDKALELLFEEELAENND